MSAFRVYIAAPYAARDGLRPFADELERIGMSCTSGWLHEDEDIAKGAGAAPELSTEQMRTAALSDLRAVAKSHAVVQFTGLAIEALRIPGANGPMLHSGGRHIELGYALARNVKVIVVGDSENIFQRTLCVSVQDWHGAVLELVAARSQRDAEQPHADEGAA